MTPALLLTSRPTRWGEGAWLHRLCSVATVLLIGLLLLSQAAAGALVAVSCLAELWSHVNGFLPFISDVLSI